MGAGGCEMAVLLPRAAMLGWSRREERRTKMIRKLFRRKRIVVGLAFAALAAAPSAQAMTGLLTDGPARGVDQPIASEISVQADQLTPLQVEGLRWQAMADFYASQAPVRSENSFGAPGPAAGGAQGPTGVEAVAYGSSGFDWSDAGIGASIAFGAALMLLTAVALGRRHRTLASV